MDAYTIGWVIWLGYFVVLETLAIRRTAGGSFSEHVWRWFAVRDRPADQRTWVHVRRLVLLGSLAWLFVHFVSGGRFP